jgi:hypothetical protein
MKSGEQANAERRDIAERMWNRRANVVSRQAHALPHA